MIQPSVMSAGLVLIGLILVACLLLCIGEAAVYSSPRSRDIGAVREEIRRLGHESRDDIRRTARTDQARAEQIVKRER